MSPLRPLMLPPLLGRNLFDDPVFHTRLRDGQVALIAEPDQSPRTPQQCCATHQISLPGPTMSVDKRSHGRTCRWTKVAGTDMFELRPPRHTSTSRVSASARHKAFQELRADKPYHSTLCRRREGRANFGSGLRKVLNETKAEHKGHIGVRLRLPEIGMRTERGRYSRHWPPAS